MKNFIEDVIPDISNLGEVKKYTEIFKEYKLVLFDGPLDNIPNASKKNEWYIRGCTNESKKKAQLDLVSEKSHETEQDYLISKQYDSFIRRGEQTYTNSELLTSILNLAKLIIENDGRKEELAFSDEIIEWCEKYGLPYEDSFFNENYYESANGSPNNKMNYNSLHGEMPTTGYSGFNVSEFKRRIHILYDIFQLWYGLTYNDTEKIIKFSSIISKIDTSKELNEQILNLKKFLPYRIWTSMGVSISLGYDEKADNYNIIPCTGNLISVAYFQLSMLMANRGGEKGVKFCNTCNKLFEIKHASVKTCDNCKKEYHRLKTRESRARKNK